MARQFNDICFDVSPDECCDILLLLADRGLFHVIDIILKKLGAFSLVSLSRVSLEHDEIINKCKGARKKKNRELSWMYNEPQIDLISDNPGHMVTCMATDEDSIVYGLLGNDATIKIHRKVDFSLVDKLVQEHNFPASISSMDCNSKILVTCAYEAHTRDGMQYAVHIWIRSEKKMSAKYRPHSDLIRGVKLTIDNKVVTASNDATIVVADISDPWSPKVLHKLSGHTNIICGLDLDRWRLVSVSTDDELRLWSLRTASCDVVLPINFPTLRVALKWPLAATGGQSTVCLWNLSDQVILRTLSGPDGGILNVLSMDHDHIVAGDHMGRLAIWTVDTIVDGHSGITPHRVVQVSSCDQGENKVGDALLSALKVEKNAIVTGGWAGKCIKWGFSDSDNS